MDGQRFEDIERYGRERWLGELAEALKGKRYVANAVERRWIAKASGGKRPLGIPTIRDRVVQTAAVLVLSPIFEADLAPELYAYRASRNAQYAVQEIHRLVSFGHREVVDADLSGYFDNIPHAELLKSVSRRISDRWILQWIKVWLQAPVEEADDRGKRRRTTQARDQGWAFRRERRSHPCYRISTCDGSEVAAAECRFQHYRPWPARSASRWKS